MVDSFSDSDELHHRCQETEHPAEDEDHILLLLRQIGYDVAVYREYRESRRVVAEVQQPTDLEAVPLNQFPCRAVVELHPHSCVVLHPGQGSREISLNISSSQSSVRHTSLQLASGPEMASSEFSTCPNCQNHYYTSEHSLGSSQRIRSEEAEEIDFRQQTLRKSVYPAALEVPEYADRDNPLQDTTPNTNATEPSETEISNSPETPSQSSGYITERAMDSPSSAVSAVSTLHRLSRTTVNSLQTLPKSQRTPSQNNETNTTGPHLQGVGQEPGDTNLSNQQRLALSILRSDAQEAEENEDTSDESEET